MDRNVYVPASVSHRQIDNVCDIWQILEEELAFYRSNQHQFIQLHETVGQLKLSYHDIYMDTLKLVNSTEPTALDAFSGFAQSNIVQHTDNIEELRSYANVVKTQWFDPFMREISGNNCMLADIKSLWRCMEKMFRANTTSAAHLFDVVRGAWCFPDLEQLAHALQRLMACTHICIVRMKNRFRTPADGWADILLNCYFIHDPHHHICEIQLVHEKMLCVRKNMGAHTNYISWRSGSELIEQCIQPSHILLRLFLSTNGPKWYRTTLDPCVMVDWRRTTNMMVWEGVKIRNTHVVALHLGRKGLSGNIPDCISQLVHLKELHLQDNHLTGQVPDSIMQLRNLQEVRLENNDLSGTLPELAAVRSLCIFGNVRLSVSKTMLDRYPEAISAHILTQFFHATGGRQTWRQFKHWGTHAPLSTWYGIIVNASGRIQEIHLAMNGVQSELIPDSFHLLMDDLRSIQL